MNYAEIRPLRVRIRLGWAIQTRITSNDSNLFQFLRRHGIRLSISNSRGIRFAHSSHSTGEIRGRVEQYLKNSVTKVETPIHGQYPKQYTWM